MIFKDASADTAQDDHAVKVVESWHEDISKALTEQERPRARRLLYAVSGTLLLLVIWAFLAEIDEVTRGRGKVIPSSQVQIVQSQDGGMVTELLVKEGDEVVRNQLLVKLDATRSKATFREGLTELLWLQVQAERLEAIVQDREFNPSEELKTATPDVVAQERELFHANLEELQSLQQITKEQLAQRQQELVEIQARGQQLARSYNYAVSELEVTEPLQASGAVSEVDLIKLRREVSRLRGEREQAKAQIKRVRASIAEAEGKQAEVELDYKNSMREQLSSTTGKINGLRESTHGLSDRVEQTSVRSPVSGTVKRLFFNTIGGIVMPGREVIEIVPKDDALLLEVRVNPRDIAFIHPDQKALVKFTAYDFIVYGGLDGTVEHIGADTQVDKDDNPFYNVRVRTLESHLGEDKPIIPGMVVEVDILTGKKTIAHYLLKPIMRASQYALRER